MKFPNSHTFSAFARVTATLTASILLAACASVPGDRSVPLAQGDASTGPRADYPVVVGEPYQVDGVIHTPADVLNYDQVGYATTDDEAAGYSAAHHTLPLPSYVEVTSLETGRTTFVRLERRGPMESNHLVALSPAAMAQLGASKHEPVRVRRVNPPEEQRAMLRAGNAAPLRMDMPMSLVTVLRRRLPESGSASLRSGDPASPAIETIELAASTATQAEIADAPPEIAGPQATPDDAPVLEAETVVASASADATLAEPQEPETLASAPQEEGRFMVQAATFSTAERAERAATALEGQVFPAGRYFRVRTGPFLTRGEAEASLANVRRAGYTDARILTSG